MIKISIKKFLLKIYYIPCLSKEETDSNQQKIRDIEWDAVKKYISPKSKFLDIGCGAGYSMTKAKSVFDCDCYGIDPSPREHGVGRYNVKHNDGLNIIQGFAENLPFQDHEFDIVYSSHVLEHVTNVTTTLEEIKRVLKPNGILIIGMPTATMAWINFITQFLFTTHHRIVNRFLGMKSSKKIYKTPFINMFIPYSHSSHRAKTVFFDLKYYKIENWERLVRNEFKIIHTLLPAIYPYPEYRQLFKLRKNRKYSSSVFFISQKK